jgi:hypothetical protein
LIEIVTVVGGTEEVVVVTVVVETVAAVEVEIVDTDVTVSVVENTPPYGANLKIVDKGCLKPGPL